jgi:23S rRNA pseudouridine2605 synthase
VVDARPDRSLVEIVMTHGRKREIRRMCTALGFPVTRLVRTGIGPLRDQDLAPGAVRPLTLAEVRDLYAAAGRPDDDPLEGTPSDVPSP